MPYVLFIYLFIYLFFIYFLFIFFFCGVMGGGGGGVAWGCYKMETKCMKYQNLFAEKKNRK